MPAIRSCQAEKVRHLANVYRLKQSARWYVLDTAQFALKLQLVHLFDHKFPHPLPKAHT